MPVEEMALAVAAARDRARKNDARFMGYPVGFIRAADWRARGPGRIIPEPAGKKELAHEIAARNFRKQREERNGTT